MEIWQSGIHKQGEKKVNQQNAREWLSFVQKGQYRLKGKLNSNTEIVCGKETVAWLIAGSDEEKQARTYDLVQFENTPAAYRFVRTEKTLSGGAPESGRTDFIWQRQSSGLSELFTGSKWQCGQLVLSQNTVRSLLMWLPRISWFIPTKYTITASGQCCGVVSGAVCSSSNSKSVTVIDPAKSWEIFAAAIILSEDEIG